jgi:hypothetical protein
MNTEAKAIAIVLTSAEIGSIDHLIVKRVKQVISSKALDVEGMIFHSRKCLISLRVWVQKIQNYVSELLDSVS